MSLTIGRFIFVGVFLSSLVGQTRGAEQPNILFILADDLGYHDLGCYGSQWFDTPNLDKLATQGARHTSVYSAAPICSASRAAILTGKTPAELNFEFVTKPDEGYQKINAPLRAPSFTLNLSLEERTIAETLSDNGYQTAFFGKWHLNQHYQRYLGWSPTHGPKAQGFQVAEEDFGSHPYSYWGDKKDRGFLNLPKGEFPEDGVTQRAVRFLEQGHEKPFFLMVSHFYVHDPIHTKVKWLHDYYFEKIPADHPRRELLAHYGAMVTALDFYVGQLIDALDEAGLGESTCVVFTSDNGGHPNYAGNAPLRGSKWNLYEGGVRVPAIVRWPGVVDAGATVDEPSSSIDLYPAFSEMAIQEEPLRTPFEEMETGIFWHFPYYHPEKKFDEAPAKIGIDDGVTSQTRPHSAIRRGPWKLIHFYESGQDELYHLSNDSSEQKELSGTEQEVAKELRQELDESLQSVGARYPDENPNYQK